ncbi:MAG: RidA family protein [Promethearchaeota archaeon]
MKGGLKPLGPYSPALKFGNFVFVSGQIPNDSNANIEDQTRQCLEKIKVQLEAAGCAMDDVICCDVFLKNLDDFAGMNKIYTEFFNEPYPTRATIGGLKIVKGAKIEIAAIAAKTD